MKISVSGATGKASQRIMREALLREIDVVSLLRNAEKLEGRPIEFVEKDIFKLQKNLLHFDTVINAFKLPVGREKQHSKIRNIFVNGSLFVATRIKIAHQNRVHASTIATDSICLFYLSVIGNEIVSAFKWRMSVDSSAEVC